MGGEGAGIDSGAGTCTGAAAAPWMTWSSGSGSARRGSIYDAMVGPLMVPPP